MDLKKDNSLAIFRYGSHVYKYKAPEDEDFILIVDTLPSNNNKDLNFYTLEQFQQLIKEHEISALECLFLPSQHIIKNYPFEFNLDLNILRKAISKKASNSYVKAKKKITLHNEIIKGQKSLFHSLRILMFGIQIAKFGKIQDYQEANYYWDLIKNIDSWNEINTLIKPHYNRLKSEFKKVA